MKDYWGLLGSILALGDPYFRPSGVARLPSKWLLQGGFSLASFSISQDGLKDIMISHKAPNKGRLRAL